MANNIFYTKRTTVSGRTPNTTGSYATNSQYIATGELALNLTDFKMFTSNGTAYYEIGSNLVNQHITNAVTFAAGSRIVDSIGSQGTVGQVLTSNGTQNVYWSTVSGGGSVNVDAQYTWTNTQTFTNNITFGNSTVYTQANSVQFEIIDTINQNYINSSANYIAGGEYSSSLTARTLTFGGEGGIVFYNSPTSLYMGMLPTFASIDGASDYNIYFAQSGGTNRGFVFMADLYANGSQLPVAQIDSTGSFYTQGGIVLANSWGTAGQVLTSNGPNQNAYWSTSVNTSNQYIFSNTITFGNTTANITFNANGGIASNTNLKSSFIVTTSQSGTTYTFTNTDSGTLVQTTSASAVTLTVPASYPANSRILVTQLGAGVVTIANGAGITLASRTGSYTIGAQYGTMSIFMANSTYCIIDGNLANTVYTPNLSAQYTWTNTQTFTNTITYSTGISVSNTTGILTINPVSINVAANATSYIYLGNSTVNGFANSTTLFSGNSTVNGSISSTTKTIANSTGILTINPVSINVAANATSYIYLGNSTVNGFANSTALQFGSLGTGTGGILLNATTVANAYLEIGNNTVNTTINATTFAFNNAASGCSSLPGGVKMNWGLVVANSIGVNVVTFTSAYGTNAYSVQCEIIANSTVFASAVAANNITKSGFTIYVGNTTARTNTGIPGVYYWAIGV